MRNVRYEYSSCHVEVPPPLSGEVIDWGLKNVRDDELYVTRTGPTFGREDEIHVTVLYGIHDDRPDAAVAALSGFGHAVVTLRQIDLLTDPAAYDVLVANVDSEDLERMHERLAKAVRFTDLYPFYHPHVTVAYVRKGSCRHHVNANVWDGRRFLVEHAVFSSKYGVKQSFPL